MKPFKKSPWVKLRTEKQLIKATEEKSRVVERFVKLPMSDLFVVQRVVQRILETK